MSEKKQLDVIVPISLELDWPTKESVISDILEQKELYGITKFALACPCGGWRSVGYPPTEFFEERAHLFKEIKEALEPHGVTCGWWITLTVKSGLSDDFIPMTKADGTTTPFANCPLDPHFRERIAKNMALFAKIAKPAFIFTEDDYSVMAAAGLQGCFCHYHLDEFAKRMGKYYTREELVKIFAQPDEESVQLLRAWRELIKDTMVGISECIRAEIDKESPEIPLGPMEPGSAMAEGNSMESVARAMAGDQHMPFCRVCGVFYGRVESKEIPGRLFHPLYIRQHTPQPFHFLHESDTFPHTRFFGAGGHMRSMMATVYSYGFEGSTFQTQQLVDKANEEKAYGLMFAKEKARFTEAFHIASQCDVKGVEMCYDPFWNTYPDPRSQGRTRGGPLWVSPIARFGIAHTSKEADVAFWDYVNAAHADHETVMKYLSKGLFLDGNAAKELCRRGYGEYLGVEIGENVAPGHQIYDLGEREVICDAFAREGKGRTMPSAHMLANGNGVLYGIEVKDPKAEVVSIACTFQKKFLGNAMTRFENKLGGRIVVMGMTLENNNSQCLYNYRRQRLFQDLLRWCADQYVFAEEAPDLFTIVNEAKDPEKSGFKGMFTLINLCEDALDELQLHIPAYWQEAKNFKIMDKQGVWQQAEFEKKGDQLILRHEFAYLTPVYILGE